MILNPIYFTTKNNTQIVFRTPSTDEAQQTIDAMAYIARHSPYILSTEDSFKTKTLESQIKWIQDNNDSRSGIIIGVYHQDKLLGLCNGRSYSDIKRKHRASLGVSIAPELRGLGIGRKLMTVLIDEMKKFENIKIIELDVMSTNITALKLYESLGFQQFGYLPKAFNLTDGRIADNISMYLEIN